MGKDKIIELVKRTCINEKNKMDRIKYYDCVNYIWHNFPYIWGECKRIRHDCPYIKNPRDCKYFVCQKKIEFLEDVEVQQ